MATLILEDRSCQHLSSVPDLPDELMWEILTRLPVKSLMRFKCVLKLWKSIILNPSFASAYRGGFRGVLIHEPSFSMFSETKDFLYLNLFDDDDDDETVDDVNGLNNLKDDEIVDDDDDDGFTCKSSSIKYISHSHTVDFGSGRELRSSEIVNGLVCFYTGNYSCLYNIATRETMELPLSQNDDKGCIYHLGFDPVNKLYKLLKICRFYDEYGHLIPNRDAEILTLGIDKSWRNKEAAPRKIYGGSVCFNGVLYWQGYTDSVKLTTDDDWDEVIIAFHLVQEKFEFISKPKPKPKPNLMYYPYYLPRFAPALALMAVGDYGELNIIRYGKGVGWGDQQQFKLAREEYGVLCPHGILPDGKVLILLEHDCVSFAKMYCHPRCCLYDPMEKKKSTRVVIHKSPSSPSDKFESYVFGCMSYFEENIIPLSCVLMHKTISNQ